MIQFDPAIYFPFFLYSLLAVSLMYYSSILNKGCELVEENTNNPLVLVYVIAFVLIVGWRPPSGYYFGDSSTYAQGFELYARGLAKYNPDSKEWFFGWLQATFAKFSNRADFFLFVECMYVFPVLYACKRFVPDHYCLMFVFCMGAFSFFSYGTNGIRNGMACSMVIGAMALVTGSKVEKIIALFIAYLAFNTHRTTALPIICIMVSYFYSNVKVVMYFWVASIFISLVAGGPVESFFTGLGFDDRMSEYSSKNIDASMFSSTGFRWDFLLYSSMPILLGYYVVIKRQICDDIYRLLLCSYILCNSFWVMMIRAAYSNRFAYLSWFMYALVLAYPLLKFEIWEDQGKKVGLILLAHLGFTMFMVLA